VRPCGESHVAIVAIFPTTSFAFNTLLLEHFNCQYYERHNASLKPMYPVLCARQRNPSRLCCPLHPESEMALHSSLLRTQIEERLQLPIRICHAERLELMLFAGQCTAVISEMRPHSNADREYLDGSLCLLSWFVSCSPLFFSRRRSK
jgi:hypothetical protein